MKENRFSFYTFRFYFLKDNFSRCHFKTAVFITDNELQLFKIKSLPETLIISALKQKAKPPKNLFEF
jgi:hypothetical protein